jgi:excisionase family DNA binding protein
MSDLKIVDTNKLMDMNEAASILGIKKSTLYALVMRKQIGHKKLGKLTRFSMNDIQEYINRNHVEPVKINT